jgi:hypothetical protein
MQNAHLRLGQLEYLRSTANIQTSIRLQVDRNMGEDAEGPILWPTFRVQDALRGVPTLF